MKVKATARIWGCSAFAQPPTRRSAGQRARHKEQERRGQNLTAPRFSPGGTFWPAHPSRPAKIWLRMPPFPTTPQSPVSMQAGPLTREEVSPLSQNKSSVRRSSCQRWDTRLLHGQGDTGGRSARLNRASIAQRASFLHPLKTKGGSLGWELPRIAEGQSAQRSVPTLTATENRTVPPAHIKVIWTKTLLKARCP